MISTAIIIPTVQWMSGINWWWCWWCWWWWQWMNDHWGKWPIVLHCGVIQLSLLMLILLMLWIVRRCRYITTYWCHSTTTTATAKSSSSSRSRSITQWCPKHVGHHIALIGAERKKSAGHTMYMTTMMTTTGKRLWRDNNRVRLGICHIDQSTLTPMMGNEMSNNLGIITQ